MAKKTKEVESVENVEPVENEQVEKQERKKKVSASEIAEQVKVIETATETIKKAVNEMPDCSAKEAFMLSVVNLEKKLSRFTKVHEVLSDEEKEMLKKFRAGKAKFIEEE